MTDTRVFPTKRNGHRDPSWDEIFFHDEILFFTSNVGVRRQTGVWDFSVRAHAFFFFFTRKLLSHSTAGLFSSPEAQNV